MDNDFVPFELAIKLKEKGFPQHITDEAYITDNYGEDEYNIGDRLPIPLIPDYMDDVASPTISQVLKWLREEKKIHLMIDIWKVDINDTTYKWGYDIVNLTTTHVDGCDIYCANSYEQAALAGIEYVLDNLI